MTNWIDHSSILYRRTFTVLTVQLLLAHLGSYISWDWTLSGGEIFGFFCLSMGILVGMSLASMDEDAIAFPLVGASAFAITQGLFLGPTLNMYTEMLGGEKVTFALITTGCITSLAGAYGFLMTPNYKKFEGILFFCLLILCGVGFVNCFMSLPPGIDLTFSIFGAIIFTIFIVVDVARMVDSKESHWGKAVMIATNIFLDILNLLLYILRILALTSGDE